jgi:DNA-binding Lrp family transcriptional regulator
VLQADAKGLTSVDRGIIAQLQLDGRTPFSTMAQQLGVSEVTIQRRTQRLIEEGYFKIIGVVHPLRFAQGQAVLIGLGTEPKEIHTVASTVAAIPEARFVSLVTGTFDVVCELVAPDRPTLLRVLTQTLPSIDGIRSVNTSWVLKNFKSKYAWNRPASDDVSVGVSCLHDEAITLDGFRLDELDQATVRALQQWGRTSYAELAAQLGITESSARRRMLRLLDSGYITVVAVGNPFRLGFHDVVLLWIKVDLPRAESFVTNLAPYPAVRYVSRVAGAADVVAEALFPDSAAALSFLDGPLAGLDGLREVAVSFEISIHKRDYVRFD